MKLILAVVLFIGMASYMQCTQTPFLYGSIVDICAFNEKSVAPDYIKMSTAGKKFYDEALILLIQKLANDRNSLYTQAIANKNADYTALLKASPDALKILGNYFGYGQSNVVVPSDFNMCVWEVQVRQFVVFNFQPANQANIGNLVSEVFKLIGTKIQSYFASIGQDMASKYNALAQTDKDLLVKIGTSYGYVAA